ncbi:MAG: hypothetical protein WC089_04190 [Candidatus Paceibacterota bacterium]
MELRINHDKKVITIKSVDDLSLLPDKSIKLLFSNSSYMTTLYLYVIYRVDVCIHAKKYSTKTRVKYYNMCVKNLESLLEFEKEFLISNSTTFVIKQEKFPKDLKNIYKDSVISTCNFFRGMLSTTPFLDKDLFPSREARQIARHNYGNMVSTLLNSIED